MGLEKDGRAAPDPHPELDELRRVKADMENALMSEFLRFEDMTGLCITQIVIHRVATANNKTTIVSIDSKIEL